MQPWEIKAHAIVAALSFQAWRAANVKADGRRRKRHVPYTIPDVAARLVKALGEGDEETAKAIFLYDYDVRGI
jgi:hypothetical protein